MLTQTTAGLLLVILFGIALLVEHKTHEKKLKEFMEIE